MAEIWSTAHSAFLISIAIIAVTNPFGNLPQFLAMTEGMQANMRKKLFRVILITALVIIIIFMILGPVFMQYLFRVTLDDLRIAGGLILIVMGVKNLLFPSTSSKEYAHYQEKTEEELFKKSIVPMAFPMLVGPGTLSTIIILLDDNGKETTILGIAIAFGFMFVLFYFAALVEKVVGKLVLHVLARIMQVFIIAMGVRMIIVGILSSNFVVQ